MRWYNHEHKHSDLKFVTPAQRHNGVAAAVLAQRIKNVANPYSMDWPPPPLAPFPAQFVVLYTNCQRPHSAAHS
ncbi:hypothetical protein PTKU64_93730 (plasmid) [Paraburkholderia terrae]|uniref:Integrase catalytic domain-containing protein n=1 Tax=Paraburkholderia terrae TaxID=311230 RepID=A0ABM7U408_9BURK|nr:hypothetical protein PTKU64_93730 [Paraburkholderia terrae]